MSKVTMEATQPRLGRSTAPNREPRPGRSGARSPYQRYGTKKTASKTETRQPLQMFQFVRQAHVRDRPGPKPARGSKGWTRAGNPLAGQAVGHHNLLHS